MSDDLVKRLRYGLIEYPKRWSGDTHSDMGGSVDYDKTYALLDEAANRIEALEAKLAKASDVIDWALICWDEHNTYGYNMQGDWVQDARTTLAELTGGKDESNTAV